MSGSESGDSEPKISMAKANRKIAKPIMEKKRRARINASLNELKTLLVEVLQKEGCRHSSKMEKADILEMAVRHLKNLQRQQPYNTPTHTLRDSYPPAIPLEKYAASLPAECLPADVSNRFLGRPSTDIKPMTHASPDSTVTTPTIASPTAIKLDSNRNILPTPKPMNSTITQPMMTRTASGEIAVVLPQHILKQAGSNNGLILPIYTLPHMGDQQDQTSPSQPVMISINMSPPAHTFQQSQTSAFTQATPNRSHYVQAPVSPVWRPW